MRMREELAMKIESGLRLSAASLVLAIVLSTGLQPAVAQTETSTQVRENELSGVVRGPNGPEAGVWVIAETTDLPTKFAKIVVTDDNGTLPHSRSSQGELQRLGAWLWYGRFAESRVDPRARG